MLISKFISGRIPTDQSRLSRLSEKPILQEVTYKSTIGNSALETGTLNLECCSLKCNELIVVLQCVTPYKMDFLKGHMIGQLVVIKVNMSHAYLKIQTWCELLNTPSDNLWLLSAIVVALTSPYQIVTRFLKTWKILKNFKFYFLASRRKRTIGRKRNWFSRFNREFGSNRYYSWICSQS